MRFTKLMEEQVLTTLRDKPKACITFPASAYREDGSIVIVRDGLAYRLHRYLLMRLTGERPDPRTYYLPTCKTPGCMNPHHREATRRAGRGRVRTTCPNGHPYTPQTELPPSSRDRCRICRDNRRARRRTSGRRAGYCLRGHKLTEANSYTWTDVRGRLHRRCRICTLERTRAKRRTEKE